ALKNQSMRTDFGYVCTRLPANRNLIFPAIQTTEQSKLIWSTFNYLRLMFVCLFPVSSRHFWGAIWKLNRHSKHASSHKFGFDVNGEQVFCRMNSGSNRDSRSVEFKDAL